ncbi:MAG: hypothetical protein ACYDDF_13400 [Thermoplasmatota archaeon]
MFAREGLLKAAQNAQVVLGLEDGLVEFEPAALAGGYAASVRRYDRTNLLLRLLSGDVDAAVLDGRSTNEGAYGWVLNRDGRLLLVAPDGALARAAALLRGLRVDVVAVPGGGASNTLAETEQIPLYSAALPSGRDAFSSDVPDGVSLVYVPEPLLTDIVSGLLYQGWEPAVEVRLEGGRPLVSAATDPLFAIAFACALASFERPRAPSRKAPPAPPHPR